MSAVTRHAMLIERRFHGPPQSEHGDDDERLLLLCDGETILADAQATTPELDPPPHVELAAAHAAGSRCLGFAHHPLPTCLGCSRERAAG